MQTLYLITAYRHAQNEWWRFVVSAESEAQALGKFQDGYSDMRFTRVSATPVCTTSDDVFKEL